MAKSQLSAVLRHVHKLMDTQALEELTDGQLLERFIGRHEEAAFAALVRQHGPMVLGVCRRVLHHWHAAEDAFQATFLVLFRRARSLDRRGSVANWLYTVAYHVALKARATAAHRRLRERQVVEMPQAESQPAEVWRDLQPVLDEELNALPDKYRAPIVLCYVEGKTNAEAARLLGWPIGTVKGRLARARELLQTRLSRRGITLSSGLLGVVLVEHASAAVPGLLVDSTIKTVALLAAGKATAGLAAEPAAALAEGVLKAMFATKLKIATAFLLAVGVLGMGVGTVTQQVLAQRQGETAAKTAPPRASGAKEGSNPSYWAAHLEKRMPANPPAGPEPANKETMIVTGRVLGPDGKPVANARVAVLASPRRQLPRVDAESEKWQALGQAKSASNGEFQLPLPRTSSLRYYSTRAMAIASGYGLDWQEYNPDSERPQVTLRLEREQDLRGRLVDLQGQPASKVKLYVRSLSRKERRGVYEPSGDVQAWLGPFTADDEGRFVLRGVGANLDVTLQVRDDRFARQEIRIAVGHKDRAKEVSFALAPAHVVTGQVTYADTGKPVAGARLMVMARLANFYGKADAEGRYQVPVSDTKYVSVYATPPNGDPYSILKKTVEWPRGVVRHPVDLALPRGIPVKGKIVEAPSGKPVARAIVQFFPQQTENPDLRKDVASLWHSAVESGLDGAFQLILPPGLARLLVTGPTPDYIHQEIAYSILAEGKPNYNHYSLGPEGNAYFGGQRVYAHAVIPLTLRREVEPELLKVTLRRGVTVQGRLVGADGKPPVQALMLSRLNVSIWDHMFGDRVEVCDGRFELRGCDPKATYRVTFFDAANLQGAGAEIALSMDVQARIDGLLGQVDLRQTFVNTLGQPLEATYIFPLPDRAAVTRFRMEVAGRVIEGVLQERAQARKEYEQAIQAGHRAAITEEERPNVFTLRVGNLMPGEQATVRLTLIGPLPTSEGEATFRFPLVVAPRYIPGNALPGPSVGDGTAPDTDAVPDASRITPPVLLPGYPNPVRLSLTVDVRSAGLPLSDFRSSLHAVLTEEEGHVRRIRLQPGERLDRDFILRFRLGEGIVKTALVLTPDPDGKEGTFALTIVPPAGQASATQPRDVVFVLDRSGSMGGWKMVAARRALGRMVDTLTDQDRFSILAFDNTIETVPELGGVGLVPATNRNRYRAVEFLAKIDARGGTEMAQPLDLGVRQLTGGPGERERILVLVTDGQVGNEDEILRNLAPHMRNLRIFTLGIDQAVNEGFLRRLATLGGGMSEVVESEDRLDEVMDKIHRRIGTPVLTGLRLEPAGLRFDPETLVPARTPDLFAGVPLFILGRYRGAATGALALQARDSAGRAWAETVAATSSDNPATASVWARGHIRELEDRFACGSGDHAQLEKRIVETSLRFSVLCRFTAFVAVDRSEVVNQGGQVQRITQPVEAPAGWAMFETDACFSAGPMIQQRLMAAPASSMRLGIEKPKTLKEIGECLGLTRVLQAGSLPAGPPPSPPQVDLSAYRQRARELQEQLVKQASKDAPTQLRELGSLAVKLDVLIDDLKSIGAAKSELRPLKALLRKLKTLLSARRPKHTAIAAAWSQAEAVLRAFGGSPAGRQEAFWK